jgi:mannose-6-phosphate isomerase-like protein (cupin superfamily)
MDTPSRYAITTETRFAPLTVIDIAKLRAAVEERWSNQTLTEVNDCVVRLGVVEGEFHWHKHDHEDEFFYVIDGRFLIDLADGETIELKPLQGFTVPKGVTHRTRAPVRTTILMVEGASVTPTGD